MTLASLLSSIRALMIVPIVIFNGHHLLVFSLFVVAIASLNLVLDFDFIEEGAEKGMPLLLGNT